MSKFLWFICIFLVVGCSSGSTNRLLSALDSPNPEVQKQAIADIVDKGLEKAVPKLSVLVGLEKGSKTIRLLAVEALGDLEDDKAVQPLVELLTEKNTEIQEKAAEALGKLKSSKGVEALQRCIHTQANENLKLVSIWALGNIGDPSAIEALVELSKSSNEYVSYNADQALKNISDSN